MFMLWFDPAPTPLAERVSRAADYFQRKYGKSPTRCLVPSGETEIPTTAGEILLEPKDNVPENHLMLGDVT